MLNIRAKFHENQTCAFREITNELTNQPTNKHARSQYLLAEVIRAAVLRIHPITDTCRPTFGTQHSSCRKGKQESCAIAKMTSQCALHMGALKIFGTP